MICRKEFVPSFLSRKKVRNFFILGDGMSYMQCLWVRRENSKSRGEAIRKIKERCDLYIKDPETYSPLIIPPEGA